MTGQTDLSALITAMQPSLDPRTFVFATTKASIDSAVLKPVMVFEETEGTTLILEHHAAQDAKLEAIFPSRMITLNIHSSLDAVGFIAHIASQLAGAGMGVNPVSGYFHDHLFVAEADAQRAMEVLEALAGG